MTAQEKVDAYIAKKGEGWKGPLLAQLRAILNRADVTECVKWGAPTYENGGNVVSFAAFKNHIALWFYQGVFLKDEASVLTTSDGTSKAMRQWRFVEGDSLDDGLILAYVTEAVENMKAGKKLAPEKKDEKGLHPLFEAALKANPKALENFQNMPLGQRNEYAEHISSAAREDTVKRRIDKCMDYISKGLDLNHKYRK